MVYWELGVTKKKTVEHVEKANQHAMFTCLSILN
ncbi:hypothetical protein CPS_0297 [Colwellia psychrerythraea 34H]|uniref:Uncharacterized protein n=1 Tax=Colwellia psychrerythraea (strain 34H / ATCC BAA-681) TaxID=167879 RepID=Q48A50_COLP3|nr:hypothetical protein CPS_0297 [Colwellia psychrerythraea 34H]